MLPVRRMYVCALLTPLVLVIPGWSAELSAGDAVTIMADRLEKNQVCDGPGTETGMWPSEGEYTGPTTAGMACAYEWAQRASYYTSAARGASYLVNAVDIQSNLLGDEAYALVKVSQASKYEEPWRASFWLTVLVDFYDSLRDPAYEGSTQAYISYFDDIDPSTSVFYLAHHLLAVNYIGDRDKDVWRDALVAYLSRVDDTSVFPVLALGAATWALAGVGGLEHTPVSRTNSSPYWDGVMVNDLPGLLLSHQVPQGEPYSGSFYWRFDHTGGGGGVAAGFTEDTVYGVLGLVAAASLENANSQNEEMNQAILAAQNALLGGVDAEGRVYHHLSHQGETLHMFAGEMLQALAGVKQYLDMQADAQVGSSGATYTGSDE
jgi:hypothetical protein